MFLVTTPPPIGGPNRPPVRTRDGLHDAVVEQEHVLITHLAVIEGWLGQLEDSSLDEAQRRRAARVVRERAETLRSDLGALLREIKAWTSQDASPED